ncbi:MAG TPA: DUF3078 domain-containing protein, partial [Prolixibacteraceae bacterium]|nr:DUF3078 domain-containing protein [Prolixibacteraceae bacterium]
MKNIIFVLLTLVSVSTFGTNLGLISSDEDSTLIKLEQVKAILYSKEWKPVDSEKYNQLLEIVNYMEKMPIDSVIVSLKNELESNTEFFKREIERISEAEQIDGYINAHEINNSMINIQKRIEYEMPLESIMVPEKEFVGMYSKLPLITYDEINRLISDSIISLPDSLTALITDAENHPRNTKNKQQVDHILTAFLDKARQAYNDSLINNYKDSILYNYRVNYRNEYIESQKKEYNNSVSRINYKLLKTYNDSISIIVNRSFRHQLDYLVNYVNRMPNNLTIYNLYDETSSILLQNDGVWFQWLWLKNRQNDSIGIRVENLNRNSMRLLVDESVNLSRLTQRSSVEVNRIHPTNAIEHKLQKVHTRKPKLSPWKLEGNAYSGFSETFINPFWSKGGKSSASTLSTFNYSAKYSKGKLKWDNGVDAKLGFIYYADDNPNAIRDFHKNSDNFEINSRFGYSAFKEWYYSAEANFKTQFFEGYKNNNEEIANSSLFSPAYLTFSAGFDYKPKPNLSTFLSPISIKTTYVLNPNVDEKIYGLDEGKTRKSRIGMTGRVDYSTKLFENISLKT